MSHHRKAIEVIWCAWSCCIIWPIDKFDLTHQNYSINGILLKHKNNKVHFVDIDKLQEGGRFLSNFKTIYYIRCRNVWRTRFSFSQCGNCSVLQSKSRLIIAFYSICMYIYTNRILFPVPIIYFEY